MINFLDGHNGFAWVLIVTHNKFKVALHIDTMQHSNVKQKVIYTALR